MKKKNIFSLLIMILMLLTLSACQSNLEISLKYKVMEMTVGETVFLTTNLNSEENEITWESSNPEVATVNENGQVEALSEGNTDIIARSEEFESKVMVIVFEKEENIKLELKISGPQLVFVNETIDLKLEGNFNPILEKVEWISSDESVAEVSNKGSVTGLKPGLVNIRATLESNPSSYVDYSVLVKLGSGVQDVIYNYIYNYSYNISGDIDLSALNTTVTKVVDEVKDGVIGVSNYLNGQLQGIGTGVIYKKEEKNTKFVYTMLTNYHVIDDATSVKAYIGNELEIEMDATILKSDASLDLAILSFEYDKELPVLEFAEIDSYENGDFVLAIGNPTGYDYYNSVTFGMISYKKRVVEGEKSQFVQHDAAINPGNSGGPLLNLEGQIIGVNTLKIASVEVEGMGFAIDLETILGFINK